MEGKKNDLPAEFERLGYIPAIGPIWSPGDLYYRFDNLGEDVAHVVYLQHQPKNSGYGIYLSAYSSSGIEASRNLRTKICRHYRPVLDGRGKDYFNVPGWILFNAGRRSRMETILTFGAGSSTADWLSEFQKVRTALLEPLFWKLREPSDVLELLFRDDYPFDWAASQVILRVALIAGIQVICGMPAAPIVERIATHKNIIQAHNQFDRGFEEIMNDFFGVGSW